MLLYILKVSACLAAFLVFYKLLLERQNNHVFKRFYLLGILALSFGIPLVTFTEYITVASIEAIQEVPTVTPIFATPVSDPVNTIDYALLLWIVYGIGVLLFAFRFIRNLLQIIVRVQRNPKRFLHNITHVLLQEKIAPHTFLGYIFLNRKQYERQEIPKEVFWHEETHARQKHSLDIIVLESLQVIFWFNPLVYYLKRAIKLNHEFLADQSVLSQGATLNAYQHILLAFSSDANQPQMANAIHYSSIKKRFTVMKKSSSKKTLILRNLILLPLLALLIYSFSDTKIENIPVPTSKIIEIMPTIDTNDRQPTEPTQADLETWKDATTYAIWIDHVHVSNKTLNNYKASDFGNYALSFVYNNARSAKFPQPYQLSLYTNAEYQKLQELENSILNIRVNKKGQLLIDQMELVPLADVKRIIKKQLDNKNVLRAIIHADKNAPKHVVTKIDDILKEFKVDAIDIVETEHSFKVSKTSADEKQNPASLQEDTVALIDVNGVLIAQSAELTKESMVDLKVRTNTQEQITNFRIKFPGKPTLYLSGNSLDEQANVNIKQAQINDVIQIFDIKTAKGSVNGPIVIQIVNEPNKQDKATPSQFRAYNSLAKKYNQKLNKGGNIQIKMQDVNRLTELYGIMSEEQKESSAPFPKFPETPPTPETPEAPKPAAQEKPEMTSQVITYYPAGETPPPAKNENKKPIDLVKEMAKKGAVFFYDGTPISAKEAIRHVTKNRKNYITLAKTSTNRPEVRLHSEPQELTPKVKRPPVVIPPQTFGAVDTQDAMIPPPPPVPLDLVKDMAKKGARFFNDGKPISSENALALVRKNKDINISLQETNQDPPVVKLYSKPIILEH